MYLLFAVLQPSGPGVFAHIGDRTECALLQFVLDSGVYYPYIRDKHPDSEHIKVFRFTPQRKSMTTVVKGNDGHHKVYSKGAVEALLSRCTNVLHESGCGTIELGADVQYKTNHQENAGRQWTKDNVSCL